MLKCKELLEQADAYIDDELTYAKRLSIRMHLFMCIHCRRYVRQLALLIGAAPLIPGEATDQEVAQVVLAVKRAANDQHQN